LIKVKANAFFEAQSRGLPGCGAQKNITSTAVTNPVEWETRMNRFKSSILVISALIFMPSLWAADLEAGKQRASACFGCHGPEGISANPKYPNRN